MRVTENKRKKMKDGKELEKVEISDVKKEVGSELIPIGQGKKMDAKGRRIRLQ